MSAFTPFPRPAKALGTVYLVFPKLVPLGDPNATNEFLTCAYYDLSWNCHAAETLVYSPNGNDVTSYNVTFVLVSASDLPVNLPNRPLVDSSQVLHSASSMTKALPAGQPDPLPITFGLVEGAAFPMITVAAGNLTIGALSRYAVLVFKTLPNVPPPVGYWPRNPGLVATSDPEIMPST